MDLGHGWKRKWTLFASFAFVLCSLFWWRLWSFDPKPSGERYTRIEIAGLLLTPVLLFLLAPVLRLVLAPWPPPSSSTEAAPSRQSKRAVLGVLGLALVYFFWETKSFATGATSLLEAIAKTPFARVSGGLALASATTVLPVLLAGAFAKWEGDPLLGPDRRVEPGLRATMIGVCLLLFAYVVGSRILCIERHIGATEGIGYDPFYLSSANQMPLAILLAMAAGICEEIVFRGYLLDRLMLLSGSRSAALVISSAAFGLIHLDLGWTHALDAAILGAGLGWVVLRGRNLWPCVWAHCAIDLIKAVQSAVFVLWGLHST